MQISIVTGPFWSPPPAPGGAVERRWFHVAKEFVKLGHDVTFLSRRHDKSFAANEIIDGVKHVRRLSLKSAGSIKGNIVKDSLYAARMTAALPKGDILVTNTFWLPVFAPRLRPGAGKVVVNVARAPKGQLWLYKKASLLVAPSKAVAEMIRKEVPDQAAKARAVANPIDTSVFATSDTPEPTRPTVVYTGRVHPEKGLDLLAKAHRQLRATRPDLETQIIGAWTIEDGGGGPEFRDELARLGGDGLVFQDPIWDRPALAEAIRGANVYVYPSVAERGESFGCAPLEAMGCGRASVLSGLEAFDDYAHGGDNCLRFDHRRVDAAEDLADKIAMLLNDSTLRLRLSAAGAQTATAYSFLRIAEQYEAEFQALLS